MFCLLLNSAAFADPDARCGTPYLSVRPRPGAAAKKTAAETFDVGDPLTVRAYNFGAVAGSDPFYLTTTTCRFKGEHCYIFVEDDIWNGPRVNPAAVATLALAFDRSTPRYRERGIFSIDTEIFGPPPDADGDPRVLIVILDIMDSSLGGTFVGYYDTANQAAPVGREILYIDSNPLDLDSNLARATLAHEFQHMLHWNADPDEHRWVDEGCSEYAELACGYKDTTGTAARNFLRVPNLLKSSDPAGAVPTNTGLTDDASWSKGDYLPFLFDQTFLLMTYFAQRYGNSAVTRLVAEPANSIEGFNLALESLDAGERFEQFWANWAAAVFVNDEDEPGIPGSHPQTGQKRYRSGSGRRPRRRPPALGHRLFRASNVGFRGPLARCQKRQRPAGDTGVRTGRHTRRRRRTRPSHRPPPHRSLRRHAKSISRHTHVRRPSDLHPLSHRTRRTNSGSRGLRRQRYGRFSGFHRICRGLWQICGPTRLRPLLRP